jgi:hypothetical protein
MTKGKLEEVPAVPDESEPAVGSPASALSTLSFDERMFNVKDDFLGYGGGQKWAEAYSRTPFAGLGQRRTYIQFLVAKLPFRRKSQGLAYCTDLISTLFSSDVGFSNGGP